ncbi:hypothetical protein I35_2444 [Burkholderia cenocepacia H111]|nr:hypothetical protein I35_2444 [Burkholderia cenocepacia H111]
MRSFDQQVTLKLGNGIQYLHCHAAGRACQIDAAKGKAMNPNSAICQRFDRCAHIHRVPAKAVKLCHDQHVAFFHLEK